ncbi:MAG: Mov34/MPN/PAD-1 family protein [Thermoplasmata archaeon]
MSLFKRKKIKGIREHTLNMVMESSKDAYPNEFAAGMREIDGIISELILVPGTISGPMSAILKLHSLPIDYSIIGVVHSHPGPSCSPSDEDLEMFSRYGRLHIIVCQPFDLNSWKAYNNSGDEIELEVFS